MLTKEEAIIAYNNLISLRRLEILTKNKNNPGQVEIHHIVPVSCNGSNDEQNKIALYAKEHFMAHVYLWIIHHDDQFHYQMASALQNMIKGTINGNRKDIRDFILASEEYQKARKECAEYMSQTISKKVSGKNSGMFGKHWYKDPNSLSCYIFNEGNQPENWIKGKYSVKTDKTIEQKKKFIHSTDGKKQIYNKTTGEVKYVSENEEIPNGFKSGGRPLTDQEKQNISNTYKSKFANNPEFKQKKIDYLRPMYQYYLQFGFKAMAQQFDYKYSQQNFSISCKTYLPEYKKYEREFKK